VQIWLRHFKHVDSQTKVLRHRLFGVTEVRTFWVFLVIIVIIVFDTVVADIGVNAAGDAGDTSPAIFGQLGTKCLISPPKFVKIVIKLPAERCNQCLIAVYKQDTQTFKERVIVLILHEL